MNIGIFLIYIALAASILSCFYYIRISQFSMRSDNRKKNKEQIPLIFLNMQGKVTM